MPITPCLNNPLFFNFSVIFNYSVKTIYSIKMPFKSNAQRRGFFGHKTQKQSTTFTYNSQKNNSSNHRAIGANKRTIVYGKSLSPKAKKFISDKIEKNRNEGRSQKQSVAIAYSQARKEGFRVPSK